MNETPKTVYDVSHVRNTGSPKWGDPYGDGASIVVAGSDDPSGRVGKPLTGRSEAGRLLEITKSEVCEMLLNEAQKYLAVVRSHKEIHSGDYDGVKLT